MLEGMQIIYIFLREYIHTNITYIGEEPNQTSDLLEGEIQRNLKFYSLLSAPEYTTSTLAQMLPINSFVSLTLRLCAVQLLLKFHELILFTFCFCLVNLIFVFIRTFSSVFFRCCG